MNEESLTYLAVESLEPHPQNPRLAFREDVIASIVAQLQDTGEFSEMHAPLVRPVNSHHQIVWGHHRVEAAKRAGITKIPCWVKPMTDDEAFMQLVLGNSQGELSPLEIGIHALEAVALGDKGRGKTGGLSEYARLIGKPQPNVSAYRSAAIVFDAIRENYTSMYSFLDKAQHLATIHKADRELWHALVDRLLTAKWSVKDTEENVDLINTTFTACPEWWTVNKSDLAKQILDDKTVGRKLKTVFAEAKRIAGSLGTVTIYQHVKTDEVAEIDGREMHVWRPQAGEYDQISAFVQKVASYSGNCTVQDLQGWHRDILKHTEFYSDSSVRHSPVLTDEEVAIRERRRRELVWIETRERYMPRVTPIDAYSGLTALQRESVDLIVMDPPYNVGKAEWDTTLDPAEYAENYRALLTECSRVLKPSGTLYLFGVDPMLSYLEMVLLQIGMQFKERIRWDTIQGSGGGLWPNRYEDILYFSKTDAPYEDAESVKLERHEEHVREYKGKEWRYKSPSAIWRFLRVDDSSHDRVEHATQKPVELIERIIKANCPEDGLAVDPFMGSGTTGIAAMMHRRRCIGFDINPEYVALAQERFGKVQIQA